MKVVVSAAGEYRSELTRIDLHRLWMQRSETSQPQVTHLADHQYRRPICFLTDAKQAPIYRSGHEVQPGTIMVSSPHAEYHYRVAAKARLGFMSLTPEDLAAAGRAVAGYDLTAPAVTQVLRPPDHLMSRLLRLHEAAGHLAASAPDILAHPEVARAIEQELVRAMIGCLTDRETVATKAPGRQRLSIMRRFEQVLGENPGTPLYLAEICAAVGVSERTLRHQCMEHLGVSPHRYLWLRRMNLARHALLAADPGAKTVTQIATDHGFWELGRFSVAYRNLFGESPVQHLRQTRRA
ncbi:MAG TPA: helix-turn-helix domain-containing protein [Rhodopila sp.]|jgi:AraC-like DNA-binding protein